MKIHINEEYVYDEGIRKDDNGHYIFDNKLDFDTDIIYLNKDLSGMKTTNNLTYYYAYTFNPKTSGKLQKQFRTDLKHSFTDPNVFYGDEAFEFVENGILHLDSMKKLNSFDAVITTANYVGEETLAGKMAMFIWDEVPNSIPCYNMQLIKRFCREVTFDEEKAYNALINTEKYKEHEDAINAVNSLKKQFERAKQTNNLFTMKHYQPVHGRVGFINFLKFPSKKDQKLYEALRQGAEVLICDDFLTTGSTVNEIIRFLNSINPNTKISVFVLIDQYRDM